MSHEQLFRTKPQLGIRSWRIDISYFYILAILGIFLGLFIENSRDKSLRSLILWSAAKSISFMILYVFWKGIASLLIRKNKKTISSISILTIGAAGGLIQAIVVELLIVLLLLDNATSVASRLLSSAIFAAFWLPAHSVTAGNFTKFRNMRESLHEQIASMGSVDMARKRLFLEEKKMLDQTIDQLLVNASDSAQHYFNQAVANKAESDLPMIVRSLASDHVRVLAHKITEISIPQKNLDWRLIFQKNQLRSFLEVFQISLKTRALNPEWFTLIIIVTISLPLLRRSDYPVNIFALIFLGTTTYLVQQLSYNIRIRSNKLQEIQTILSTTLNIFLLIGILYLIPGNNPRPASQFALAVVVVAITIIGHMAQAGLLRQNDLMQTEKFALEKMEVESAFINMELVRISKKWAEHIHGNLQSKLHAYSLVLEQSQENRDLEGIEAAIEGINQVFKDFRKIDAEDISQSLGQEVTKRCGQWEGLIEISIDMNEDTSELLLTNIVEIGDCINEAITNAVRHGGASKIEVQARKDSNFINFLITDDGNGIFQNVPGFGSRMFDSATGSNWKLFKDSSSSATVLTLAFVLNLRS
jgi:signal transduction histidine kinase